MARFLIGIFGVLLGAVGLLCLPWDGESTLAGILIGVGITTTFWVTAFGDDLDRS
jgi:hypothetical protein